MRAFYRQLANANLSNISLSLLPIAGLLVLATIFSILLPNIGGSTEQVAKLGQYGDFFGGFSNPALTFLTFIGVLYTIYLQNEALKVTRLEAAKAEINLSAQSATTDRQNFESTFFQMLQLHNTIVNSMDVTTGRAGNQHHGRDCFSAFYNTLNRQLNEARTPGFNDLDMLAHAYSSFWEQHRQDLGHYFRFLYNMVRFIDESGFRDDPRYIRLVRAQLSDFELIILFYNCLTVHGAKFRDYAIRYTLLNNMPREKITTAQYLEQLPLEAFFTADELEQQRTVST